jgi:hypothetical protein
MLAGNNEAALAAAGIEGLLGQIAGNTSFLTNLLTMEQLTTNAENFKTNHAARIGEIWAQTNQANILDATSIRAALPGGWSLAPPADNGGGGADMDVLFTPNGAVHASIGTTGLAEAFLLARTVISWLIYIICFITMWKTFYTSISSALTVPQATTSGESFLGTNVNVASTLVMAAAIVACIGAITIWATTKLIPFAAAIVGNPFAGLGGFGYNFLNAVVPVTLCLAAVGTMILFRITVNTMGMVAGGIVKLLVGL